VVGGVLSGIANHCIEKGQNEQLNKFLMA